MDLICVYKPRSAGSKWSTIRARWATITWRRAHPNSTGRSAAPGFSLTVATTLILLSRGFPWRRLVFLGWWFLIGERGAWGRLIVGRHAAGRLAKRKGTSRKLGEERWKASGWAEIADGRSRSGFDAAQLDRGVVIGAAMLVFAWIVSLFAEDKTRDARQWMRKIIPNLDDRCGLSPTAVLDIGAVPLI